MARPLSNVEDLKNPRRIRKSPTTGQQLDIPQPSKREKAKWASLVAACMSAVLATDRIDNISKKERVVVHFSDYKRDRPKWFPAGIAIKREGKSVTMSYASDMLLLVLWQHKLADYNPSMLHAAKRGLLTQYEDMLDSVCGISI